MDGQSTQESAVIVVRKSQIRSVEEREGVKRQKQDCTAYCKSKGFRVHAVYEEAESAYSRTSKRVQLDAALRDIESGNAQHLVVWKLDRLTRRAGGIHRILERMGEDGKLHSVTENIDATTVVGRMVLGVLASIAEQESENISLRVKRATLSQAQQGKKHGGQRQYGFNADGTVNAAEAPVLRECAARMLSGESMRSIARDLNERAVPTKRGRQWSQNTIRQSLLSPSMRGVRRHNGDEYEAQYEAIFTVVEHNEILQWFKQRPQGNRGATLFGALGVLRCGRCESLMRATTSAKHGLRYVCASQPGLSNCGRVAARGQHVDAVVVEEFLSLMESRKTKVKEPDRAAIEKMLAEDKTALEQATAARYVHRRINDEQYSVAYAELTKRIAQLEATLQRLSPDLLRQPGKARNIRAYWDSLSHAERRDLLRSMLIKVLIMPTDRRGNTFDRDRVVCHWRPELLARNARSAVRTKNDFGAADQPLAS